MKLVRILHTSVLTSVLACGVLFSAAGRAASPSQGPSRVFTLRLLAEPETLDWNRAHTTIETYILTNIMEGLVAFDSNLKVAPALADNWKVSADGKTYTFKLHPGVKWSDGVPLKAKDFVYSWKRLLTASTAASYAYLLYDIVGAEDFNKGKSKDFSKVGIQAINDQTLQVKLVKPVAYWLDIPTFWVTFPLREDVVEKFKERWTNPDKMVTLGPYLLAAQEHDSKIQLKANPSYYGTRGNVDQVDCLIVKDDSTALNLYEAGKLDFLTDIATLDLKRLAGRPDLKTFPYLKTGYMGFVTNKGPMANVKFRRAVAMAIDKSRLGEILHGGQLPATSFVPPRMLAHSENLGLPYDPARAKEELKASGIDPAKASVDMVLPNWDKPLTIAQFVQGELKKNLGIQVNLQQFDHKTFRAQVDLKQFPIFILSWSADYPDPDNFMSVFMGDSGNNRTAWNNKEYDHLVMAARDSMDARIRERDYQDAQRLLIEDEAVILPLYYEPNMALIRTNVQGLELNPLNYLLLKKVSIGS